MPTPLPIDGGVQGMLKQDGSALAFNRMGGSYWRKGYKGNRSDDVWVQDLRSKKITRLTDIELKSYKDFTQDVYPMWGSDGQIYFSSERSGIFNIYRIAAGGGPTQINPASMVLPRPTSSASNAPLERGENLLIASRTPAIASRFGAGVDQRGRCCPGLFDHRSCDFSRERSVKCFASIALKDCSPAFLPNTTSVMPRPVSPFVDRSAGHGPKKPREGPWPYSAHLAGQLSA